jgi:hypothetical protein
MEKELLRSIVNIKSLKEDSKFIFNDIGYTDLIGIERTRQPNMFFKFIENCGEEIGVEIIKADSTYDNMDTIYKKSLYVNNELQADSPMWDKENKELLLKALENLSEFNVGDKVKIVDLIDVSIWDNLEDVRMNWLNKALEKLFYCGIWGIEVVQINNQLGQNVYKLL